MMRTVMVSGSLIGLERGLDDGNAGADPAVLENALGVTWDALDLCLSYGLNAAQAKALLTVRPFTYRINKHLNGKALRRDDGRVEQRVDGTSRERGIVPEVRDRLVPQNLDKNFIDRLTFGVRRVVGLALAYLRPSKVALQPAHQAGEPRSLASVGGHLAQDRDCYVVQRFRPVFGLGGHRLSPEFKAAIQARRRPDAESGSAA